MNIKVWKLNAILNEKKRESIEKRIQWKPNRNKHLMFLIKYIRNVSFENIKLNYGTKGSYFFISFICEISQLQIVECLGKIFPWGNFFVQIFWWWNFNHMLKVFLSLLPVEFGCELVSAGLLEPIDHSLLDIHGMGLCVD